MLPLKLSKSIDRELRRKKDSGSTGQAKREIIDQNADKNAAPSVLSYCCRFNHNQTPAIQ